MWPDFGKLGDWGSFFFFCRVGPSYSSIIGLVMTLKAIRVIKEVWEQGLDGNLPLRIYKVCTRSICPWQGQASLPLELV